METRALNTQESFNRSLINSKDELLLFRLPQIEKVSTSQDQYQRESGTRDSW